VKQILRFRQQAEECRRIARQSQNREHKASLLRMAENWESLEAARQEEIKTENRLATLDENGADPSAG
jgi:hypothetical protein